MEWENVNPTPLVAAYQTECLKTLSVWSCFTDADLRFRPAPRARTPLEHMVHQCVSEDTWMRNMLGIQIDLPALPVPEERLAFLHHYAEASGARREILAEKPAEWWAADTHFFDVERSRSWVFMRRLTHSAHHRGQLTVYLRLLDRPVYSTYGPTADTGGLFLHQAPCSAPEVRSLYESNEAHSLCWERRHPGGTKGRLEAGAPSKKRRPSGCVLLAHCTSPRPADLHPPHQSILDLIDVLDLLIREKVPVQIVDDLVHVDHDVAVFVSCEVLRLHVGINQAPLAGPVLAHPAVALDTSTFHPIRPVDIRAHPCQGRFQLPGIESAIEGFEKLTVGRHETGPPAINEPATGRGS